MGWDADLDAQNEDGNTPMHLAVLRNLSFSNQNKIKEMLFKGANRDIRNKEDLRPIDMIEFMDEGEGDEDKK